MTLLWKWSLYKPAVYLGLTIRLLMNTFILHSLLKLRLQTMFASKLFTLTNLSLSSVICHTTHSAWAVLPGLAEKLLHNTGIQLCWVLCSKMQKCNYVECLIRTLLNSKAMKTDTFVFSDSQDSSLKITLFYFSGMHPCLSGVNFGTLDSS